MKSLNFSLAAAYIFFAIFSAVNVFAQNSDKNILVRQFWQNYDEAHNASYEEVDEYRSSLEDGDPERKFLASEKNFKRVQNFVRDEFILFCETNFNRQELAYLSSLYQNPIYRKYVDLVPSFFKDFYSDDKIHEFVVQQIAAMPKGKSVEDTSTATKKTAPSGSKISEGAKSDAGELTLDDPKPAISKTTNVKPIAAPESKKDSTLALPLKNAPTTEAPPPIKPIPPK